MACSTVFGDEGSGQARQLANVVFILKHRMGISLAVGDKQDQGKQLESVLVLGGTGMGKAVVQILRSALPDAVIIAACYSDNPEVDVAAWPVEATYAIDGDYEARLKPEDLCENVEENLIDQLRSVSKTYSGEAGVEAIVDVAGKVTGRRELEDLLIGAKILVERDALLSFNGPVSAEAMAVAKDLLQAGQVDWPLETGVDGKA